MALQNTDQTLINKIKTALYKAEITLPQVNEAGTVEENGQTVKLFNHPNKVENVKYPSSDKPTKPLYETDYNTLDKTGLDILIETVVKETLNYIIQNASVRLKNRLDTLENDFNSLLDTMVTEAGTLSYPLVPVGTALGKIAVAGGGSTRNTTKTTPLKANEITDIG